MRHRVAGRSFGRRPEQRKALLRGLATALLERERIETTVAKAKELRRVVEPLVTLGKRGDLHARRQAARVLYQRDVLMKLFGEVAERFKDRPGGYTRIMRLGQRRGDGAEMALIELIPSTKPKTKGDKATKSEKTEAKAPAKEKKAGSKTKEKPAKQKTKAQKEPKETKKPGKKKAG